jgi:hypothetical protein
LTTSYLNQWTQLSSVHNGFLQQSLQLYKNRDGESFEKLKQKKLKIQRFLTNNFQHKITFNSAVQVFDDARVVALVVFRQIWEEQRHQLDHPSPDGSVRKDSFAVLVPPGERSYRPGVHRLLPPISGTYTQSLSNSLPYIPVHTNFQFYNF